MQKAFRQGNFRRGSLEVLTHYDNAGNPFSARCDNPTSFPTNQSSSEMKCWHFLSEKYIVSILERGNDKVNHKYEVCITVKFSDQEAWDFAQFLKEQDLGFSSNTVDDEAHRMIAAAEKVRKALADVGYSPAYITKFVKSSNNLSL